MNITGFGCGANISLESASGVSLVAQGTGPNLQNKGLAAGAGVTLVANAGSVTISSAGGGGVTLASSGGAVNLVSGGTGPALAVRGLTAGAGIAIASDATSATISSSGSATASLARAEATSYALSAARDLWTLATGQGGNGVKPSIYP